MSPMDWSDLIFRRPRDTDLPRCRPWSGPPWSAGDQERPTYCDVALGQVRLGLLTTRKHRLTVMSPLVRSALVCSDILRSNSRAFFFSSTDRHMDRSTDRQMDRFVYYSRATRNYQHRVNISTMLMLKWNV